MTELGKLKQHQILVDFSAQSDFYLVYAQRKLIEKNLDFVSCTMKRQKTTLVK
ncbi:hypothetical protein [Spiroplasma endosymbiont of Polydrusus pterygomalis]|uniref:hypothetical protein n=1 Tax=Spiroplasma endosymbiont of Polydrusus pterygomalis TaxID=3139327 RepID=UPI003CCAD4A7